MLIYTILTPTWHSREHIIESETKVTVLEI